MLWPVIANEQSNVAPAGAPRDRAMVPGPPLPRPRMGSPMRRRGRRAIGCRSAAPRRGPGRARRSPGRAGARGDVDEFDAALIAGAGGVAANAETLSEAEIEAEAEAEGDLTEDELQEGAGSGRGGADGVSPERASGAPIRKGNRAIGFLRASWAELQRVQWPDRRHVFQATAVVLGFVAIAGAYLGLADYVAKEIVDFIL